MAVIAPDHRRSTGRGRAAPTTPIAGRCTELADIGGA